jgi:hypothetical protein
MLIYSVDNRAGLVIVTATGAVTGEEVRALQARARSDPQVDPRLPVLLDYRRVETPSFSADDLRRFAEGTPVHPSARRAIVVAEELAFGLARMFEAFSAIDRPGSNVRVFKDIDAARAWLLAPAGGS